MYGIIEPEDNVPILNNQNSVLSSCLTKEIYSKLYWSKTSSGCTVDQCIQIGIDCDNHEIGFFLGDYECIDVFEPLLGQILDKCHPYFDYKDKNISHIGNLKMIKFDGTQTLKDFVIEYAFHLRRNLRGYSLPPHCTRAERREINRILIYMLKQLQFDPSFPNLQYLNKSTKEKRIKRKESQSSSNKKNKDKDKDKDKNKQNNDDEKFDFLTKSTKEEDNKPNDDWSTPSFFGSNSTQNTKLDMTVSDVIIETKDDNDNDNDQLPSNPKLLEKKSSNKKKRNKHHNDDNDDLPSETKLSTKRSKTNNNKKRKKDDIPSKKPQLKSKQSSNKSKKKTDKKENKTKRKDSKALMTTKNSPKNKKKKQTQNSNKDNKKIKDKEVNGHIVIESKDINVDDIILKPIDDEKEEDENEKRKKDHKYTELGNNDTSQVVDLVNIDDATLTQLEEMGLAPSREASLSPEYLIGGLSRDFPDARALFYNEKAMVGAWTNHENHLEMIIQHTRPDLNYVYKKFVDIYIQLIYLIIYMILLNCNINILYSGFVEF